jgi:hypothetical protein
MKLSIIVSFAKNSLGHHWPGVYDPGANKFFCLSSPPPYTCSSLEDDAVVLLLLVEGPVVVTGIEGDGNQAFFF